MMGIPISARTGCWIKYQLNLRNITLKTAAKNAGVGTSMVSEFLRGRKDSERVKTAICAILGYPTFESLLATFLIDTARTKGKGGAA
jgi:transcriptional regulator with XRE-family HTH domain